MRTKNEDQLKRLKFLRDEINRHDRLYYVEARPEIGDADYDALYREMEAIEREHPEWVTPDSPTQRVSGEPVSGFRQVRHDPPMQSLDKTHSFGELVDFDAFLRRQLENRVWDYVVEPKVDGLSMSLLYENGQLVRAATRGNGEVGDDVTANIRTIKSIPLSITGAPSLLEVRGEVYMTRDGFVRLNRQEEEAGREPFANPRNAAAGSLKQLDPREVAKRPLDMVIYAAGAINGIEFATHTELIRTFAKWGFKIPPWQRLCIDMPGVLEAIRELEQLRHSFPFEIDGAVVKINQRNLYSALGSTAHAPRWARAFKYQPERTETVIESITVQVGRTGVLTPVAELTPVPLAGSTISRATLHNADDIARKDIRIGDHVWLVKAGDVIPAIESVITQKRNGSEKTFVMPDVCPACGQPVVRNPDEVAFRCVYPACPAQRVGRLEHFCSRDALDIRAIGGKVADALVTQGLVSDPLDLFSLSTEVLEKFRIGDEESGMRKFGRNAKAVAEALQNARGLPLHRWLFATGITNIGVTISEQVAALHPDLSALANSELVNGTVRLAELAAAAASENPRSTLNRYKDDAERQEHQQRFNRICGEIGVLGDQLVKLGGATRVAGTALPPQYVCAIKPESARELKKFFDSDYGREYVRRLLELGINPKRKTAITADGPLKGISIVITGTLSRPRGEFAELIKNAGGTVQESVSKNTDYLLAGANVGATKTNKAKNLGVQVIDEARFMELLGGAQTPTKPNPPPPKSDPPKSGPKDGADQLELF